MGHLLMRGVAAIAVVAALVTVSARNADGESAHRNVGDVGSAVAGAQQTTIKQISLASIADANAWNSPGGSSRTSMMVTEEQKTAIRRQLDLLGLNDVSRTGPKTSRLAIGARLPRETTRLSPVPSQIARIVPRYGAYEYFLTENGAFVVVDPSAYEIVDMIGA